MGELPLVEKFLLYTEKVKGCSMRTRGAYEFDLSIFSRYLEREGLLFGDIDMMKILEFIVYLREERMNNKRSVNRKLATLKSYYTYLVAIECIEEKRNPTRSLPRKLKEDPVKLPVSLSLAEIKELFSAVDRNTVQGIRDYAILVTFYVTGVRVSELCSITIGHIDWGNGVVLIKGKGGKERYVPMNDILREALQDYLATRADVQNEEALFLSKRGGALSPRGVQYIVSKYANKACITKKVSPHKLRHTCATHLLRGGQGLDVVSRLLGHSNISTTQIYVHVTLEELIEAVRKHPINQMAFRLQRHADEYMKMSYQGRYG
jgi:site-specific recombinase XerD